MAISRRMLEKYRSESLRDQEFWLVPRAGGKPEVTAKELNDRVLKLTQELIDIRLIQRR